MIHPFNSQEAKAPPPYGEETERKQESTAPVGRVVRLHKMLPNLITLTALSAGLSSIQFTLNGRWEMAVIAILIAVVLDALDGATARLLKAQSEFGAQLDSLSDFLAFGVAPAIILHTWILNESGKVGWIAMIVYAACVALRLARFNVTQGTLPTWKKGFFSGIPSPAGAGLALLPLVIWFQLPESSMREYNFLSPLVGIWTILVAAMMVSSIPTFSTKIIHLPAKFGMPVMACVVVLLALLAHAPWPTLTILAFVYMASIPFSIQHFQKLQLIHEDKADIADLALGAVPIDDLSSPVEK